MRLARARGVAAKWRERMKGVVYKYLMVVFRIGHPYQQLLFNARVRMRIL